MKNRFPTIQGALAAACVHTLEMLLEEARRGEIIGLAYAVVLSNNAMDCGSSGAMDRDPNKRVGALVRCAGTLSTES